ncbi:efflux RND transporter periplasmic adaptor subunit [Thiohalobacter sp. IOR34]|uniref:efflux RND transporter periplasmic adaptor subunit n=1 Tax=Thiohalobacter sp. IOR34 TaxID=3057176 RepID=UPI0025B18C4A|nr:efflux RND transporter periplasmic adaptor subunit [Thiohalobacter sp. IOR34]WJW74685.1 efflux RND transporter periplasmic adaptor subunit [Thiohalobacter sp. IOR34]
MNKIINKVIATLLLGLLPSLVLAGALQLTEAQLANVSLDTATVVERESRARLELNGILTADGRRAHRVAPIVGGIVRELRVVSHERVRKGQVLARLHSHRLGLAQADYLEALARFELARAERARIEGLWKDGIIAESRWLRVDSEYKSARATLEARRRLLSLAGLSQRQIGHLARDPQRLAVLELASPVDGVVTEVAIEPGQMVAAGLAAFQVVDLSVLWAMVNIPVDRLPQVELGAEAVIRVAAGPGQTYRGRLESLGGQVDAESQTLTGRIVLANDDGRLRPGMYAEISLAAVPTRGLMVPVSAVFRVGDSAYVFKVLGRGRFEAVPVVTGSEAAGWVSVLQGIEAGATVVSKGVAELKSHWQYEGGE